MPTKLLTAGLLVVAATTGCGSPVADTTAGSRQFILGGEASSTTDDAVVKILSIQTSRSTQTCTGAFVAPNLVITARHCVADYVDMPFTCDSSGEPTTIGGGQTGAIVAPQDISFQIGPQPTYNAKDAVGTQVFALQTTNVCRNDIALVLLDRSFADLPILPMRLDRGTTRGERVRAIGYGVFDPTSSAGFGVRYSKDGLIATKIGTSQFHRVGDDIPPRSFEIDGGALCIGDSGGPALSDRGAVMGVFSKFTGDCTATSTVNFYTETGPFSDELIRPAFLVAGAEPLLEADPGAAAAAGSDGGIAGNASTGGMIAAGGTAETDNVGAGTAGTYIELGGLGGASTATESTDADGGAKEITYDGAQPKGGTCRCHIVGGSHQEFGWIVAMLTALVVRRRQRSHASRSADNARTRAKWDIRPHHYFRSHLQL